MSGEEVGKADLTRWKRGRRSAERCTSRRFLEDLKQTRADWLLGLPRNRSEELVVLWVEAYRLEPS